MKCKILFYDIQVGLGQLYYQGGRGVEINHDVSIKFSTFLTAFAFELSFVQSSWSIMASYDCFEFSMFQRAMNYFLHAAEAGNANAMAFLGKVCI